MAVGIDLVSVDEVAQALDIHGERYLRRVFTEAEQRDCHRDPRRLAARFAAKEATMKALRRTDEPLPWRSIEVQLGPAGDPVVALTGAAARLADEMSLSDISVSLTHEGGLAGAVVIAECAR